ncbi:DUF302 domain-containing protein [Picrophilus oshimae]|uniref:Uncharacterized conserved protein, DUF302 family n=1 Tax=Picrophilus torridus (strain ATCC 700027 / DSM 9790 / JCM 10055 / NBRC 100828 / KAW 2/3) TaxID=1122961 RepID=A0A8G2FY67_PICTO|nr:DUF302 domain-containing protein [Picrophilus oshimae]SMD31608.1 Uncharacterized conserved protein, DUF302 family [Picrophilus oshimae DSM 9789]
MFSEFKSSYDFNETLIKIKDFLNKNNVTIFCEVDHKKNAESVNMELNNEYLIVFGSPVLGTHLMIDNPRSGIELPLRILIYEKDGVNVLYVEPEYLKSIFSLGDEYINKISGLIKALESGLKNRNI